MNSLKISVLVVVGFLTVPTLACSCFWGSLESSFASADVVVEAKLRSGTEHFVNREISNNLGKTEALLGPDRVSVVDVSKVWKGEDTDSLTIHSQTGYSCGYSIPEDKTMILFASFKIRSTTDENSGEAIPRVVKPLLYTGYCSDNVKLSDDASSQNIQQKLDRLQQKAEEAHKTQKHRKVLRERIREILKSADLTQSNLE